MVQPLVSIVIPTHNQSLLTIRCLESIRRNTTVPYELIWVDNHSSVSEYNQIYNFLRSSKLPVTLIKFNTNQGFVRGTNAGIKEAQGDYVTLLNNDTEVGIGWATRLIDPLKNIAIGAVGPVTQSPIAWQAIHNVKTRFKIDLPVFTANVDSYSKLLDQKFGSQYVPVRIPLAFFCTAFRREIFNEIGLLDEDFGYGLCEDDEFCSRMWAAELTTLLSVGTFVYHHHRTTFRALRTNVDAQLRRNMLLLGKKRKALG